MGGLKARTLKLLVRHEVPPLTDRKAWAAFPYQEYDVVVIDSLDAATEGVGEQDSAKPAKAIASVLDIVRRVDGPAFLIPGNTTKSGASGRGNGVIEDRADIVFEVRDATDFTPSMRTEHWWMELPPAGREDWKARAARTTKRPVRRLAFIPTKYRGDEEPSPYILELDYREALWTLGEVTAEVVSGGREGCGAAGRGAGEGTAGACDSPAAATRAVPL